MILYSRPPIWVMWNLFLALIPVGLGYTIWGLIQITPAGKRIRILPLLIIITLTWLAFLPNSCYLLTEWRHYLSRITHSPTYQHVNSDHAALFKLSTSALFYLIYSGMGLLCFTLAIRPIERACRIVGWTFPVLAYPFFLVVSIGVYLGLILRFNSWEVITNPRPIFQAIARIPQNTSLTVAIVIFALLLWFTYEAIDLWADGIMERLREWSRSIRIGKTAGTTRMSHPDC